MKLLAGRLFGNPNNDTTDIEEATETSQAKRAPADFELTNKVGFLEGSVTPHIGLRCIRRETLETKGGRHFVSFKVAVFPHPVTRRKRKKRQNTSLSLKRNITRFTGREGAERVPAPSVSRAALARVAPCPARTSSRLCENAGEHHHRAHTPPFACGLPLGYAPPRPAPPCPRILRLLRVCEDTALAVQPRAVRRSGCTAPRSVCPPCAHRPPPLLRPQHTRKGACVGAGGAGLTGVEGWRIPHKRWEGEGGRVVPLRTALREGESGPMRRGSGAHDEDAAGRPHEGERGMHKVRCPPPFRDPSTYSPSAPRVAAPPRPRHALATPSERATTTPDASPTPSARATTTPDAPPTPLRAKRCAEGQRTPPPPPIAYAGCATPPPRLTHPRLLPHTPLCAYAVGAGGAGGGARKGGTRNEGRCNPSGERPGVAPPALCPRMRAKLGGCAGRAGRGRNPEEGRT
ncbi:hypothetical protein BJY52DRAFT_1406947 [Lactarius psammicola]|nr:hypothetical protein BJY52DRAFT_1406947 [Lactarius psammicola]